MRIARHAPRRRLTDDLADARIGLIEAPGGFGKSALIDELREHLGIATVTVTLGDMGTLPGAIRRGARQAGLSDVARSIDSSSTPSSLVQTLGRVPGRLLVAFDEVQRATPETVRFLHDLAAGLPEGHQLVLSGRSLAAELRGLESERAAVRLDAAALAFTAGELETLLGDEVRATRILAATGGWPAACALAAARLEQSPGATLPTRGLTPLVDQLIEGSPELAVLGHLPLISTDVAEACCGDDALERLVATGLPLRAARGGWLELPDPVSENLAARGPLPVADRRAVATRYAEAGELRAAVDLLRTDGPGLAALLGAQRWTELAELDLGELQVILGALSDADLSAHPRSLLHAARIAERSADVALQETLLLRSLEVLGPGPAHREAQAALAAVRSIVTPGIAVERMAEAVLESAPPTEYAARARALLALARVDAWRGDPQSMHRAENRLGEVVGLCRVAHEAEWEAAAHVALGYRVCFARGDLERALEHLTAALALVPEADSERATMLTFLATVFAYVGRLDEAESAAREAGLIARTVGDHRAHAYADWAWSVLASLRLDRADTLHRIRSVERHFGPWFAHPTGAEFLADATVALARVGDEENARRYATRAVEHAGSVHCPEIALWASGVIAARFGDPAQAERDLLAYAASPQPDARDEWHILLFRAEAARRAGRLDAASLADEAYAAAAALGHPGLPNLHEPDLGLALGLQADPDFAVRVLGAFHVSADGRQLEPPPGRPTTLVKFLAVRGAGLAVPADEIIEVLWPGISGDTGRARLRNLLSRLRAVCGELVERSDDGLRLSVHTRIDATRFATNFAEVRTAPAIERPGLARAALAGYAGELLPEDRYADWTAAPRTRLQLDQLELLELLVDDAVERGDIDEAIRQLEAITAAEPLDAAPLIRAAELLLFQGRRGSAQPLVQRALEVTTQVSRLPDRRLARLALAVGLDPGSEAIPLRLVSNG